MDLHKLFLEVLPGRIYSVSEAARYLGVHRCTVYAYISHPERPLPFVKMQDKTKLMFRGADLIAYKAVSRRKAADGKTAGSDATDAFRSGQFSQ